MGRFLGEYLEKSGAKIFFTDINENNIKSFKQSCPSAELVGVNDIYDIDCDIYAPCALGATINDDTIERLRCKIVAGAANNQLATPQHGDILRKRGILYTPDYLINAGGLMNVSIEFEGWSETKATRMVDTIYKKTLEIFNVAEKQNITTNKATDLMAEARIESIKKIQGKFLGRPHTHRFPGRKNRHLS